MEPRDPSRRSRADLNRIRREQAANNAYAEFVRRCWMQHQRQVNAETAKVVRRVLRRCA